MTLSQTVARLKAIVSHVVVHCLEVTGRETVVVDDALKNILGTSTPRHTLPRMPKRRAPPARLALHSPASLDLRRVTCSPSRTASMRRHRAPRMRKLARPLAPHIAHPWPTQAPLSSGFGRLLVPQCAETH